MRDNIYHPLGLVGHCRLKHNLYYNFKVNGLWNYKTIYRAVRCVRAPKGSVVNFTAYQNFIELI